MMLGQTNLNYLTDLLFEFFKFQELFFFKANKCSPNKILVTRKMKNNILMIKIYLCEIFKNGYFVTDCLLNFCSSLKS